MKKNKLAQKLAFVIVSRNKGKPTTSNMKLGNAGKMGKKYCETGTSTI